MIVKPGYRQLTRQPRTCFVAVSREKITLHQNYLHTFCNLNYFLIKYFFVRKFLWFRNFTASRAKWFKVWYTRNLSLEVTTATWINLYICFISRMFLCCKHISQTRESSVANFNVMRSREHLCVTIIIIMKLHNIHALWSLLKHNM